MKGKGKVKIDVKTYLPEGLRREKGAIEEGTNEEERNEVGVSESER